MPRNRSRPRLDDPYPEDATADQPVENEDDVEHAPGVLIVREKPSQGSWLVIPPLVAMMFACAALLYRVGTPDWRWGWPSFAWITGPREPAPKPLTPVIEANARPATSEPATPPPQAESAASAPATTDHAEQPSTAAADVEAAPVEDEASKPPAPRLAEAKPDETPAPLSDLQREADRIKAEREELERIKRDEAKKLAEAPRRRPGFNRFFVNPNRLRAAPRGDLERRLEEQMEAQLALIEEMMRDQAKLLGNEVFREFGLGDFGRFDAEFDRMFEMMKRDLEAFERQAQMPPMRERMRRDAQRRGNGNVPPPPEPGKVQEDNGNRKANSAGRRLDITDRNGQRIPSFEIRTAFQTGDD
jgi:hypothetical protein